MAAVVSSQIPLPKLLATAIQCVSVASKLCLRVRSHLAKSDVITKSDSSPVTIGDYGVQCIIAMSLKAAFGESNFRMVAEENPDTLASDTKLLDLVVDEVNASFPRIESASGAAGAAGTAAAGSWTRDDVLAALGSGADDGAGGEYWILDPIDGTKGFVRGDQYAVGLAFVRDGFPQVGVLGCPNLPRAAGNRGCIFAATHKGGAFEHTLDGTLVRQISVVPVESAADAIMCQSLEAGHSRGDVIADIASSIGIVKPSVRMDSMCKYGSVACGDTSLYIRLPREGYVEWVWDHAAGAIILQEAGGLLTDLQGKPLDFTQGRSLSKNLGIVAACSPALHSAVVQSARALLKLPADDDSASDSAAAVGTSRM